MISRNSVSFSLYIILVLKPCKNHPYSPFERQKEFLNFCACLVYLLMWYVLFTRFQYLVVQPLIVTKVKGHFVSTTVKRPFMKNI